MLYEFKDVGFYLTTCILFRRKGLGLTLKVTLPSPEDVGFDTCNGRYSVFKKKKE